MNKASLLSILIVAFALNACGNAFVTPQVEDAEQRHGVAVGQQSEPPVAGAASTGLSYLEATIEACSDIDGYERDPCERDRFQDEEYYWISYRHPDQPVIKSLLEVADIAIYPPRTTREHVRSAFESASKSEHQDYRLPHVVVRAVFTPGTTRCAVYNHRFNVDPSMPVLRPAQHTRSSDFLGCFIEIEVREYLSGIGPRTLTVHPDIGVPYHEDNHAFYQTDDYLTSLSSHVGDIWEGAEVVVWLGTHTNVAVESWRVVRVGYLQRDEAGEVFLAYLGPYPYSEDYDVAPYADRLKPTLVDYRRDIRLGIEESSEAVGLTPIGDANQGHLQAHLNRFGVYEMTEVDIVPPPPVPSE